MSKSGEQAMDEHDKLMKTFTEMRAAFEAAPPESDDFDLARHYYGLFAKAIPVLDQLDTELARLRKVELAAHRIVVGWRVDVINKKSLDALVSVFDSQS